MISFLFGLFTNNLKCNFTSFTTFLHSYMPQFLLHFESLLFSPKFTLFVHLKTNQFLISQIKLGCNIGKYLLGKHILSNFNTQTSF